MKKSFILFSFLPFFLVLFFGAANSVAYQLYDLITQESKTLKDSVETLKKNRIILAGELHSNEEHHRMQLAVIQALHDAGVKVAIGLEMFRYESQEFLDLWVAGEIAPDDFHRIYYDNWNYPWPAYSMIFNYARENGIAMVGLNIGREITQQVAHKGFGALSEDQKGKLQGVVCIVDEKYMDFIQSAFGDHAHGNLNFNNFCEAQLVWDNIMAIHALEYLNANSDTVMVLLTGNGHALKPGIPAQIKNRSDLPHAVILPETPGYITSENITIEDADFLISK
ncbi:MAG: ChaN family lipoprotein [Desulfobacterales bacterium]